MDGPLSIDGPPRRASATDHDATSLAEEVG